MRQIKFRAWHLAEKKMLEVDELNHIASWSFEGMLGVNGVNRSIGIQGGVHNDCIVMQSTGLFDKNGKEIYEGDIIKYSGNSRYWTVYWNEVVGQFRFKCYGFVSKSYGDYAFHSVLEYRIVGDIHETPELINQ